MNHVLVIDIGNTRLHFAIFADLILQQHWHVSSSDISKVTDALTEHLPATHTMTQVIISSVVPKHNHKIMQACQHILGIQSTLVSNAWLNRWINIHYEPISSLGTDRLVNALAARQRFAGALIVVDAGTAITFDLINRQGDYQAGPILPGLHMSLQALHTQTAQLKQISFAQEPAIIITNTTEAMQSGCYWAAVAAITGIIAKIKQQQAFQHATVILTGGSMQGLQKNIQLEFIYEAQLNLYGLADIAQLHREEQTLAMQTH